MLLETAGVLHADLVKVTAPQDIWQPGRTLCAWPGRATLRGSAKPWTMAEITDVHHSLTGGKPAFR